MDGARLSAYRAAQRSLALRPLDPHERERLRDVAEALLLTRAGDAEDAERLRRDAALALSLLVGQRRIDDESADRIWTTISDCGPQPAVLARRPRRDGVFAGSL